jgi:hypothetical protein
LVKDCRRRGAQGCILEESSTRVHCHAVLPETGFDGSPTSVTNRHVEPSADALEYGCVQEKIQMAVQRAWN